MKKIEPVKQSKQYRTFTGIVTKAAMAKTITVRVDSMKMVEKYNKRVRTSRKYHVHDEKGLAHAGDTVSFVECRPLSRTKRWRLVKVTKTL